MARRVSVHFIAEMAAFKRGTREGAAEVRKLRDESKAAQVEVAKLGDTGTRAGRALADGLVRGSDGRLRALRGRFVRAGEESGKGFGDGFERGAQPGMLRVAALLGGSALRGAGNLPTVGVAIGLAAVPATAAAAAAALQTIPPLLAVIGGGLGAVPALAAGAAGGIGVLKLGVAGLGDAIDDAFKDDRDPYAQLSANGQKFVTSLAAQRDALVGLRGVAQDRILAGLDGELADLSGRLLPFATRQVTRFGDTWNQTFKQLARVGRDPVFLAGLNDVFTGADRFFDNMNARIPVTGRMLGQLFSGSIPMANQLGDSVLEWVDDFNSFIARQSASGGLDDFFRDAAKQADALLDLSRELLALIGRIGGMQQGSTLLRDMADAVERFNNSAHDMRSVEGIIATGNAALRGVVDVLLVVGDTLGETLADPATRDAIVIFFDVLKVGAEIVGSLASLFRLLPDPIQSTVIAAVALTLVAGKLFAMFGRVQTAAGGAADRLREVGPAGDRAARGLQAATLWAGRAAAGFASLYAASMVLAVFRDRAADVDHMTDALRKLAATGEVAGEMQRIFGSDLEKVSRDLAGASGWWEDFNRGLESGVPLIRDIREGLFGVSFSSHAEDVQALDEAMARLVETSGRQAGIEAWNRILSASGMNADELIKLLPQFEHALTKADEAAAGSAAQQRLLNGTMREAITLTGTYTRAWQQLNGAMLSSDEAMLAAKDALDEVKESFKENGKAIEGNSRKALENRVAVGRFAAAAAEAAQKKYEETGSIEAANKVYGSHIDQLRSVLRAAGLTDKQVDTLIGTYSKMPKEVYTKVTADTKPAKDQVAAYKAWLRSQNLDKTSTVRIRQITEQYTTRGGNREFNRWGGLYNAAGVRHMASGGVLQAHVTDRPMVIYGERETGGEAFIPRNGDPARSISIARQAMSWYGMDVVPRQTNSPWTVPTMIQPPAPAAAAAAPAAPFDPMAQARAIRAALIGVSVQMDGRVVGYLTGRDAGLMAR